MSANEYRFITRWRVEATCGEVADILGDPIALTRWWPSVYLEAEELRPPDPQGIGRLVLLRTKGWLPYTLRWELEVVESRYPLGFTIVAHGDFDGRGIWTFRQDGRFVDITYDWRVAVEKPMLRSLSFLLRPIFEANHRWAMRQGEESLALELERRRAPTGAARTAVSPPPGPITFSGVALLGGIVVVAAATAWLAARAVRSRRGQ